MIIALKGSLQFPILDMKNVEDKQLIRLLLEIDLYTQGEWIASID